MTLPHYHITTLSHYHITTLPHCHIATLPLYIIINYHIFSFYNHMHFLLTLEYKNLQTQPELWIYLIPREEIQSHCWDSVVRWMLLHFILYNQPLLRLYIQKSQPLPPQVLYIVFDMFPIHPLYQWELTSQQQRQQLQCFCLLKNSTFIPIVLFSFIHSFIPSTK